MAVVVAKIEAGIPQQLSGIPSDRSKYRTRGCRKKATFQPKNFFLCLKKLKRSFFGLHWHSGLLFCSIFMTVGMINLFQQIARRGRGMGSYNLPGNPLLQTDH